MLLRHGPADARSRAGVARRLHGVIMHCDAHPIPAMRPSETPAWRDPLGLMLASTGEGVFGVDLEGLPYKGSLPSQVPTDPLMI